MIGAEQQASASAGVMSFGVSRGAAICSVGVSLPDRRIGNAAVAGRLGLDADWIKSRTGIEARRVADPGESLTEHAVAAATAALRRADIAGEEIDLVVVATMSQDELIPNAAPLVAHAIGAHDAGAFDVGAACNCFLAGLSTVVAFVESGHVGTALLIGADLMSRFIDPDDRGTAGLFGDGAGAVVVRETYEAGRVGPIILGADGSGSALIRVPRDTATMSLQGHETFRVAVSRLSVVTLEAVAAAELTLDDIDLFVYHQANARILQAVGRRLELDPDRVVDCIAGFGNTSAASIPIALDHAARSGSLRAGAQVLIAGFGSGVTWGAAVVEWDA
jgi:3-oxoacyl-[acyl-carrier-protein] synthase III